jgi:peptidoglycan/LPS O-acetylase OafA/YrhL
MSRAPGARLRGLEALRGIAAIAAVFYHVTRHERQALALPVLSRITQCGHAGVDLFFVLSGFIILFVHEKGLGRPGRWTHYAGRRFNRVFPTYWIALGLTSFSPCPAIMRRRTPAPWLGPRCCCHRATSRCLAWHGRCNTK